MRKTRAGIISVAISIFATTGCSSGEEVDKTPLPATASPPYICNHIPLDAVERMTGLHAPLVKGNFKLNTEEGYRDGWCGVYQPTGNRWKVLDIELLSSADPKKVESEIRDGAKRLPQILSGGSGYYSPTKGRDHEGALAVLIRGDLMLVVDMDRGAEGRDHEADVVALMRLIAPKLMADSPGAPSPTARKGA